MKIFDKTIDVLQRSMDLSAKRHALISSNVANSETPGYRSRELDFGGELTRMIQSQSEIVKTNPMHMDLAESDSQAHTVYDQVGAVGADGNNVDMDIEVGKMSENMRRYDSAANYIGLKLRMLKEAARGPQGV